MKGRRGQIDPSLEKTTLRKPSLIRVTLLDLWEVLWWSDHGFVSFVVIGLSLGEINDFSVLGIEMDILGV